MQRSTTSPPSLVGEDLIVAESFFSRAYGSGGNVGLARHRRRSRGIPRCLHSQALLFAGAVPLQCTSGGPVIEDRLRSQASKASEPCGCQSLGSHSHCHCCSCWVCMARLIRMRWVQVARRLRSITSRRIASHRIGCLPDCLPCLAYLFLLIVRKGCQRPHGS